MARDGPSCKAGGREKRKRLQESVEISVVADLPPQSRLAGLQFLQRLQS
ncbi:hypothetical protein BRUCa_0714 [Brucella melitensis]|nr:hypothetical protein BM28_A0722 [Brucella melitensis M28]AEW13400.1 hypothetical protein BCA52141_I0586 [Brucella canis HSK A52141]AEW18133.1 hypothetical protein BAA13334_I02823 [Brucella abortus A13334]AIB17452.1 Hypothetical protein BSSP3_I0722 [Brucella suis bv. 2]AIB21093.1 Hypothetical protein BSPT1_I1004 [Brucella suis bv. 2]